MSRDPASGPRGVEVAGVRRRFGDQQVLDGVDLLVEPGSTTALLGPSGCGKTTLLRIIAGLESADEGRVVVGGETLTGPGVDVPPERRRIGMVFQDWALFPHLSVARNVGFGLPRGERRASARIDEALELVGLPGFGDRAPDTLSGGQQQRVALARAIAPRPSVLLLDEPFSNLDAALRARVRSELHELLVGLGITTILVTHDQDEAFVLGDRVAVMEGGRLVQVGAPAELYQRPVDSWVAGFVGECNLVDGHGLGATVETVFGALPVLASRQGPCRVLMRPESLGLVVDEARGTSTPGVVPALVELVEFVGHSTVVQVRLSSGERLRVREPGAPRVGRGTEVGVRPVAPGPWVAFTASGD